MKPVRRIYLDHNATTPVDPRVLETMLPWFHDHFGNASSQTHSFGWEAAEAVDLAREQVAHLLHASPAEIYFCSGASEAISLLLTGLVEGSRGKKNHLITSAAEHSAVLDTCAWLEKNGTDITRLPVLPDGQTDLSQLEDAITDRTLLICLLHANNETGVIHPLADIARIARHHGVFFLTDATQSVGKIPLDLHGSGVDFAVCSAHKLYGPKGVGAMFVRKGLLKQIQPRLFGGGQEKGLRPGTLNVPGIVGLGKACEICREEMPGESSRLAALRDALEVKLLAAGGVQVNGSASPRLPHTSNLTFQGIDGSRLIHELPGLAVSQGAACSSAIVKPSHVLTSMGLSDPMALSSLRIGLGRFTPEEDICLAAEEIQQALLKLRT